jgi:hypothetical protein
MAGRTGQPGEELDRRPAPITRLSAIDLPLLQGVVEKGQNLDPRNIVLRAMSAAGTVAAGVLGITVLPKTYSQAVASFNGPVLTALSASLPDFTTNQLMRLNQTAFAPNTLVASRQSKLMVVFVPQALLLNEHQRKLFRFAPSALWPCVDLRRIQVWVDGSYIREVGR